MKAMNHKMIARAALTLLVAAGLAGCGSVKDLRPKEGMGQVPKAAAAPERETPKQLMTPSTQAKPDRQADLLDRSMERAEDPFDLPPGPNNGRSGAE
ncbi:hypothetical protein [Sphingobium sp. B12D2B]|uniref:hypothetical protein n=1 Tax=Sphingobium sp. B12D2B TaxID=2940577 RepID=UPI00222524F0|nr:hypothetical protein [Sphingobium sp. B12D2B]MCW2348848.1 uncharacterized protein YceK [Sphingobium sp. B12D2B]